MASVVSMYRVQSHSFTPSNGSSSSSTAVSIQSQAQSQQQEQFLDESYPNPFCRALYDYDAQDSSALSFHRGDIIEVLNKQPSGWWDGLLGGEERGWFPSNYVTVISEEEAEMAFSGSDASNTDVRITLNQPHDSVIDMSHAMMRGSQEENEDWLDSEVADTSHTDQDTQPEKSSWNMGASSSDFWMPQVAPNGQIFYVNTKTGLRSRDLPLEADDDTSDSDLAGLSMSPTNSRSETSAGFGVYHRTGTPEPWVKKLADDGMAYYYYNSATGDVQWMRPEPAHVEESASSTSRNRVDSNAQLHNKRMSVYSDTSDVQPLDTGHVRSLLNGSLGHSMAHAPAFFAESTSTQLTSAERIAQSLQQALAPPPPELLTDLSASAKIAIQAVIDSVLLPSEDRTYQGNLKMDQLIYTVVSNVRNLLYVSAIPTGQIPSSVLPRGVQHVRNNSSSQSPLKPAQRKVTATLSRLVLSAWAMQYDSGSLLSDTLNRIAVDAEELERSVLSFVLEVQRQQHSAVPDSPEGKPLKRLQATFSTANIGLGLVGGGAAGHWKGFGWVSLDNETDAPQSVLGPDVMADMTSRTLELDACLVDMGNSVKSPDTVLVDHIRVKGQNLVAKLNTFINFVTNIHVARHVDIDGIHHEGVVDDLYLKSVEKARILVRALEVSTQALFDDSAALLLSVQVMRDVELPEPVHDRGITLAFIEVLTSSLNANVVIVQQTLEGLLSIGHEQADMSQGDYNGSIEWRMSRLSMIDTQFGGSVRPLSTFPGMYETSDEDMIDMELAFTRPGGSRPTNGFSSQQDSSSRIYEPRTESIVTESNTATMIAPDSPLQRKNFFDEDEDDDTPLFADDASLRLPPRTRPRGKSKADKLQAMLGAEVPTTILQAADANHGPWYLRPNTNPTEILVDTDGTIKGGTLPALVERLTPHDHSDPNYVKSFLMTFKSFTTVDELFDLLVERFWIQPPPKLTSAENDEWVKLKKNIVQTRVLNIFKTMISEPDTLEGDDLRILDRLRTFVTTDEVSSLGAAKGLLIIVERTKNNNGSKIVRAAAQGTPPAPIVPKSKARLKLLDIDPLELARQLTLFESSLYQKIRPMECLQRAREQKTENLDNIAIVIQTSNRIADWVAESVLSKEDSRKRAATVKHLISVADRCRTLNNFSTMIAITSGLNTPPIRRLKRTWEQVSQRFIAQFSACEMTIDSNKNFNKYRSLMATVNPPCVPFIGVFLSTLQFIQDGNPDILQPGGLVNFRKRQKASEVISDIKRWQQQSFNFVPLPQVQEYIKDSLAQYSDTKASSDEFWALSLEREPREREDEKMARLLQESGFL